MKNILYKFGDKKLKLLVNDNDVSVSPTYVSITAVEQVEENTVGEVGNHFLLPLAYTAVISLPNKLKAKVRRGFLGGWQMVFTVNSKETIFDIVEEIEEKDRMKLRMLNTADSEQQTQVYVDIKVLKQCKSGNGNIPIDVMPVVN